MLDWIEFVCVLKLYPLNWIARTSRSSTCLPICVRPKQYDRLSQQLLSLLLSFFFSKSSPSGILHDWLLHY